MAYKIAILVGSLREGSLNRKVARSICGIRGDNLDCSMIEIGDLPLYNQDLDANPPEQWVRFRQQIAAADFHAPHFRANGSAAGFNLDGYRSPVSADRRLHRQLAGIHFQIFFLLP